MRYEERIVELPYGKALPALKKSLLGYWMNWERRYVGVTSRPDLRCQQHAPDGWERMYVLYKAVRGDLAQSMEKELILFARNSNYRVEIENRRPGGEGINAEGASYVYVLLANKT